MSTSVSGLDVPLLQELRDAGYDVQGLHDLRKRGVRYPPEVAQILVSWLDRTMDDPSLQEKIVRALSLPWARKEALRPLLDLFRTAPGGTPPADSRRWAIGNALEVLATDTVFDDMAALAADQGYGASRQMIVLWLGKTKKHRDEAVDVLLRLLDQEEVSGQAVEALAKLKDPRSRSALQEMTNDSRAWVRTAALRGVAALEA